MRPAMLVFAISLAISAHAQSQALPQTATTVSPSHSEDSTDPFHVKAANEASEKASVCGTVEECHAAIHDMNVAWRLAAVSLAGFAEGLQQRLSAVLLSVIPQQPATSLVSPIVTMPPPTISPSLHCFSWKLGDNTTTDCY